MVKANLETSRKASLSFSKWSFDYALSEAKKYSLKYHKECGDGASDVQVFRIKSTGQFSFGTYSGLKPKPGTGLARLNEMIETVLVIRHGEILRDLRSVGEVR